MPNQREPTPRTNSNTNYQTQCDKVTTLEGLVVEDGTIVECNQVYYCSVNGNWEQFAPLTSEILGGGWARYDDGTYNLANPYNFTTTPFFIPNDGREAIDSYDLNAYDGTKLTLELGATYMVTVAFKAHLNTSNGHMAINLDCVGDAEYSRIGDILIFPKGNGVEHVYSRVFNFYVNTEAQRSGIKVKMTPSHSGSIYSAIYYIQKLSNA